MEFLGKDLHTYFAPSERLDRKSIEAVSLRLKNDILLPWFDAVPTSIVVVNECRQIVFCNKAFSALSERSFEEIIGLRPGEALNCIHADSEEAGCGCSLYCNTCGAARAMLKSMGNVDDVQNCHLLRTIDNVEAPMDLQVFTHPVQYQGQQFVLLFAVDVSHEMRLNYLTQKFHHALISAAGGIESLSQLIEHEDEKHELMPLLSGASKRILRDVLYHRDLASAEQGRLAVTIGPFDVEAFLNRLIEDECEIRGIQSSLVELDIEQFIVFSDKRLVGHIIRNLFINALEAMENMRGKIVLRCLPAHDSMVSFIVENPGEMDGDIVKQMFKRYVSTKAPHRGLGNYAVKLFAEEYLHGAVEFSSGYGKTQFEVRLPKKSIN